MAASRWMPLTTARRRAGSAAACKVQWDRRVRPRAGPAHGPAVARASAASSVARTASRTKTPAHTRALHRRNCWRVAEGRPAYRRGLPSRSTGEIGVVHPPHHGRPALARKHGAALPTTPAPPPWSGADRQRVPLCPPLAGTAGRPSRPPGGPIIRQLTLYRDLIDRQGPRRTE